MLALAQGLDDVAITLVVSAAAIIIVFGVDRFPPTRYLLDRLDPSRVYARHPSAGPPKPSTTVRLVRFDEVADVEPIRLFDFERHA